jgi:HK97 family phage prohead protease
MIKESRERPERRANVSKLSQDGNKLVGLCIPYNSPSEGLEFVEIIVPGAFAKSLASGKSAIENRPITFVFRHDDMSEYGDTSTNLKLEDTPDGIRFSLDIPDYAIHLKEAVASGRIKDMSFEFYCIKDRWEDNTRFVVEADLVHISAVPEGAYPMANVSVRNESYKLKNKLLLKKIGVRDK